MFFEAIPNSIRKPLRTALPHVGLATCSIVYVCFGALLFYQIEEPNELKSQREILAHYERIKQRLISKTFVKIEENADPARYVDAYMEELLLLLEDPQAESFFAKYLELHPSNENEWTPMSAFLLAATTVIPVGYGFITPATKIGRLLIIVYGLFGAPLALVTVTDIGEFMSPHLLKIFEKIPGISGFYCLTLLGLYILTCALLFHFISTISLLDAIYFSITTVFTIGYGDTPPPIPIPMLVIFILLGVTLVTITVEVVAGEAINQIHYMGRKVEEAREFARKVLQMGHIAHVSRVRLRSNGRSKIHSFSNLGLLMKLENRSILLNRPTKINFQNKAYAPEHLHIEFVDVTTPDSSETSARSRDLISLSSIKSRETLSSVF